MTDDTSQDGAGAFSQERWLGAVPVHKFVNRVAIAALSIRARQAIENRGFLRHRRLH